jgi:hypothetical protein
LTTRTTLLKRASATVTAAAVALAGVLVVMTTAPAQASMKKIDTPFSYRGSAYGTRVTLGDPGQGGLTSGRTAWSILACTKMAPLRNDEGSFGGRVNANSMVQVGAIDSFTSSYRKPKKKVYGSRSVNRVADIVLGAEDGPRLKIGAARTTAHAYNANGRFRAAADFDLVGVSAVGILPEDSETPGPLNDLLDAIDQADDELVEAVVEGAGTNGIHIPNLGTVYPAGTAKTFKNRRMARSNAFGIRVELDNGSTVTIGRARATIEIANPAGVFGGLAYGLEADVADGTLRIGRTPFQIMRCVGTNGRWVTNSLAELPRHESLNAGALRAETLGKGFADGRAVARSRASVANLSIGGRLEIQGVVGKVNVFQNAAGRVTRRNLNGTRIGAIIVDGEAQVIPAPGESLEIPGLAVVKTRVRQNFGKRGVQVHAVRVELLDGTGMVLNIGTARARIGR